MANEKKMLVKYFEIENRKWKLEEVETPAWGKGRTRFELTLWEDDEFFGRFHFATKEKAMLEILSYNEISEEEFI